MKQTDDTLKGHTLVTLKINLHLISNFFQSQHCSSYKLHIIDRMLQISWLLPQILILPCHRQSSHKQKKSIKYDQGCHFSFYLGAKPKKVEFAKKISDDLFFFSLLKKRIFSSKKGSKIPPAPPNDVP